jgi:DHA1 family bicyclomycin/chloramphenicol resistance-like MFS transporter
MVLNMFLPSLPSMAVYFETDYRIMQLSVALYLGAVALLQMVIGPLSDRFGRRPVLLGGILIFLAATLGCLFATNAIMFLVFRMIQATSSVSMVLSRAIARDMFDQSRSASMIGYITMGMAIVPMLSPALGGILDEQFGWKASFWVFFIFGCAVFALSWMDVGETNRQKSTSFAAQVADYPELFLSPRFWGYCLTAALTSGAFFAYLGGAPFVGSEVYGLAPSELGLFFGAPALGYMAGNFLSGRYSVRFGGNTMIFWGAIAASFGTLISLILAVVDLGTVYTFFGFMIFVGIGNGMVLPNANAGMLSVRPHLAGTASGLGGAIMMAGGAALSAIAGAMLRDGGGPVPLLLIMAIVTALSIFTILFVIRRERVKGIA